MSKAKANPAPTGRATDPALRNGLGGAEHVLTLAEAAAYLRVSEEDVLRMVHEQGLHARQVGSEWRFWEPAIADWLRTGPQSTLRKGRAAHPANEPLLAQAGTWKDDPLIDEELQEIYRRRGEAS